MLSNLARIVLALAGALFCSAVAVSGGQLLAAPQAGNDLLWVVSFRLEYLAPVNIALWGIVVYLLKRFPPNAEQVTALLVALATLAAVILMIVAAPLLDPETQQNVHRLNPLLFILLVTLALSLLADLPNEFSALQQRVLLGMLGVGLALGIAKYSEPKIWQIERYRPFSEEDFPARKVSESGSMYYLASNPQQVYGYFIRELFHDAPLRLEIVTDRYVGGALGTAAR